ncbi:MAG: S1 RNA-binding domain-containing protein [Clostridia bacterium]|nr:S1 RNA-binding domain-containing protein [Clostridia bacterium]
MAEIGEILDGKVTGLTKFGAFVDIGDGQTGMVHISEVAPKFVNDISEYLEVGQEVKVKVLGIDENEKISLSIKQADATPERKKPAAPNVWQGQKKKEEPENPTFEDMMSKWKSSSDEKMADLKRASKAKHSGYGKRSGARR